MSDANQPETVARAVAQLPAGRSFAMAVVPARPSLVSTFRASGSAENIEALLSQARRERPDNIVLRSLGLEGNLFGPIARALPQAFQTGERLTLMAGRQAAVIMAPSSPLVVRLSVTGGLKEDVPDGLPGLLPLLAASTIAGMLNKYKLAVYPKGEPFSDRDDPAILVALARNLMDSGWYWADILPANVVWVSDPHPPGERMPFICDPGNIYRLDDSCPLNAQTNASLAHRHLNEAIETFGVQSVPELPARHGRFVDAFRSLLAAPGASLVLSPVLAAPSP